MSRRATPDSLNTPPSPQGSYEHQITLLTRSEVKGVARPQTLRARLARLLAHPLLAERVTQEVSVCLTLTTDTEVHELNRDYRGKDKPTDVLSFALTEGEELWLPPGEALPLGDIIISVDTATRQAARGALPRLEAALGSRAWSVRDELSFLMLHGLLHLLGYDHEEEEEAEEMEALELALLPTLLNLKRAPQV